LRSPEITVEAITTVSGNVEVRKCTRNVLKVLSLLQPKRIPIVAEGAAKPLGRALVMAPEVHGRDGLGDVRGHHRVSGLSEATRRRATDVILDSCNRFGKKLTIVALGPLTNLAKAWRKDPHTLQKARHIVSMGGAFRVPGNTGPVAEFNYFVDPEAAEEILTSGLPVRVVPLDATETVRLEWRDVKQMSVRYPGPLSQFLVRCTKSYMVYHKRAAGFFGGFLHDPVAVAAAFDPSLFEWHRAEVHVETQGVLTRGMSVADFRRVGSRGTFVTVALGVRHKRVLKMFRDRVWDERR
jgi:inosine-uridine nucleoside N-ribohydrolase